jgi:membrane protein
MASPLSRIREARPVRAASGLAGAYGRLSLGDHAAALTYYAVLAVFPGMIVLVALLGLFGDQGTVDGLLRIIEELAPGSAADTFEGAAQTAIEGSGAGIALLIGTALALYSASGYIGAFNRTANSIYEVDETRPFWKKLPRQVVLTLFLLVVLAIALGALLLTGPLAQAIAGEIGLGDTAVTVWSIVKWPVLAGVIVVLFAVLLHEGPNVDHKGFRALIPGSALAMLIWLIASAGFSFYVANFGAYSNTYGSIAGVIVFLIWLWLSNLALLLGATFNVEYARTGPMVTEAEAMTGDEPADRPPSATAA